MIFCREVQYYNRCNCSAVSIGNNIFPNGIMKLQVVLLLRRFTFPHKKYKDGPLNPKYVVFFSKIYNFGVWIEVWLILLGSCNPNPVSAYLYPTVKSKKNFRNIPKSNYCFQRTVMSVQYRFLYLILIRHKFTVHALD
jgi:hypothetical protein